ncbi:Undecaprenyl-phosphate 4-deoxy-4-formamido-L-arabinose transferase [Porphyromonas levii]|uniref:glycosyltransferase family 2 protein n=1 Tax=Porphyromonas levii TaxID=28114 RepID=UPI001B8CBB98|nr:glycosyltransferase family 2 protein [Porphyromonas levii]MBR8729941.1 Undecaprenyl-phosphate 4-deoxy-4-formamido-L-arabinose transferase [Porphyromonas levii]
MDTNHSPFLSIIVPVYNVEKYLNECVDSILGQDFTDFELILVDDGSPDNCPAICDEYAEKDNRVIVIHKENGGLSSARNAGIDICKGEYIWFIDSDDYISPGCLGFMSKELRRDQPDILYFGYTRLCENSEVLENKPQPHPRWIHSMDVVKHSSVHVTAWSNISRRNIWKEYGVRFLEGIIFEDYEIHPRLLKHINRISYSAFSESHRGFEPYIYRIREGSIMTTSSLKSRTQTNKQLGSIDKIEQNWQKYLDSNSRVGISDYDNTFRKYYVPSIYLKRILYTLNGNFCVEEKTQVFDQMKSIGQIRQLRSYLWHIIKTTKRVRTKLINLWWLRLTYKPLYIADANVYERKKHQA